MLPLLILLTLPLGVLQAPLVPPADAASAWERVQQAHARYAETGSLAAVLAVAAQDLRDAAGEAVAELRAGAAPEDLERHARERLLQCLEFYPLVAGDAADLDTMLAHLEDGRQDQIYRTFLIEHVALAGTARGPLAAYFLAASRTGYFSLRSRLGRLSTAVREEPPLRVSAMEALFRLHLDRLQQVLAEEPALHQRRGPDGRVDVALLRESPQLSPRTARAVEQTQQDFVNAAKLYARELGRAGTPGPIHDKALELLHRILDEIPLHKTEEVRALLP